MRIKRLLNQTLLLHSSEYTENATKDVACTMVECILGWTENTAPAAVVAREQDTIANSLPADTGSISDMSSQVLIDTVRPHLNRETLQTVLRNDDL
jgi:hypothetical protein